MCHSSCIAFGTRILDETQVTRKRVLEVGSYDVNGSLRPTIEAHGPYEYVGVDIAPGPGVDLLCDAGDLVERFGAESFDVVVATELLEHVRDWRSVVSNLKRVCRRGGILVVTTRSTGFPYHAHPADYWRYEVDDFRTIFDDLDIVALERDEADPGVFLAARKPETFTERDLDNIALYSIVGGRNIRDLDDRALGTPRARTRVARLRVTSFVRRATRYASRRVGSLREQIVEGWT